MRRSVVEATQRATQSGALKKITAGVELLPPAPDSGVRFLLFEAQNAVPKPLVAAEETPKAVPFRDPFAREHLERELFITQLHGTHNVVLNKFNVVDEHVRACVALRRESQSRGQDRLTHLLSGRAPDDRVRGAGGAAEPSGLAGNVDGHARARRVRVLQLRLRERRQVR